MYATRPIACIMVQLLVVVRKLVSFIVLSRCSHVFAVGAYHNCYSYHYCRSLCAQSAPETAA
jgi:hypothetical protein